MENRGLLFIPDISGFTRFVNETEITHSRMIIQELLETLINTNHIGLKVSEIEGDAILFYKFGEPPPLSEIYQQVQTMFCNFHKHLMSYDHQRYCYCPACNAAVDLTLKVITHYGEFTGYRIQQFEKLIGRDIIVAHQLLKNNITNHEYWLITENLVSGSAPSKIEDWMAWDRNVQKTESGDIPYHYTFLAPLKSRIPAEKINQNLLAKQRPAISISRIYNRNIIHVFHAAGDFNQRHRWQHGTTKVEDVSHSLPRVGMMYRKVTGKGEAIVYSKGYSYTDDRIEYIEREENKQETMHYLLEKINDTTTRFTWSCYIPDGLLQSLRFNLFKKNTLRQVMLKSMDNLEQLLKTFEPAPEVS